MIDKHYTISGDQNKQSELSRKQPTIAKGLVANNHPKKLVLIPRQNQCKYENLQILTLQ